MVLHNADCMPLTDRYSIHCTNDNINLPCACSFLRREGHSQHEMTCRHHRGAVGCQPPLTPSLPRHTGTLHSHLHSRTTRALSTHTLTFTPHEHSPLTLRPFLRCDSHTCDLGISVVLHRAGPQQLTIVNGIEVGPVQGGWDRTHHTRVCT